MILYFNDSVSGGAANGNASTLANWWQDDAFTIPATSLPTTSTDVYITGTIFTGTLNCHDIKFWSDGGSIIYSSIIYGSTLTLNITGAGGCSDSNACGLGSYDPRGSGFAFGGCSYLDAGNTCQCQGAFYYSNNSCYTSGAYYNYEDNCGICSGGCTGSCGAGDNAVCDCGWGGIYDALGVCNGTCNDSSACGEDEYGCLYDYVGAGCGIDACGNYGSTWCGYDDPCQCGCESYDNCGNCNGGYGGCTDGSACNYDSCATNDNGSCYYDQGCGCWQNPPDNCGICGGGCMDDCGGCGYDCGGGFDALGYCNGDAIQDCAGNWYSPSNEDGNTHSDNNGNNCNPNSLDCAGYCCGSSSIDLFGACYGSNGGGNGSTFDGCFDPAACGNGEAHNYGGYACMYDNGCGCGNCCLTDCRGNILGYSYDECFYQTSDRNNRGCDSSMLDALGYCCGDAIQDCAGNWYSPSNEDGNLFQDSCCTKQYCSSASVVSTNCSGCGNQCNCFSCSDAQGVCNGTCNDSSACGEDSNGCLYTDCSGGCTSTTPNPTCFSPAQSIIGEMIGIPAFINLGSQKPKVNLSALFDINIMQ